MKFGTILKSRGRYVARFRYRGRSHQKTFPRTRTGKAGARRWLAEHHAKITAGVAPTRDTTFRAFARSFAPQYRARLRAETWVTVSGHIDRAVEFFGSTPISHILRRHARAFLAQLDVGPATMRRYAASLSSVFEAAIEEQAVDMNPFLRLRLAKPDAPERDWPTYDEARRLLGYVSGEVRLFAELVLETGLRRTEAATLTVHDIRGGFLIVRADRAKSHLSRDIPLSSRARGVLRKIRKNLTDARLFRYGRDYYGRHFSRAMKARGVRNVTIHTLRHSAATRFVRICDLDVAQRILGHADIKTTRLYVHARKDDIAAVAKAMDDHADASEKAANE